MAEGQGGGVGGEAENEIEPPVVLEWLAWVLVSPARLVHHYKNMGIFMAGKGEGCDRISSLSFSSSSAAHASKFKIKYSQIPFLLIFFLRLNLNVFPPSPFSPD